MREKTVDATKMDTLGHDEAMRLARTEYDRFADLLSSLSDKDLRKQTDCDRWDVGEIVSHLISMSDAFSSFREMMRQQKAGKPFSKDLGLSKFDGWTEMQARRSSDLGARELLELFTERASVALRRRESIGVPVRWIRIPSPPYGFFSFAYLLDDILTRDVWMHRVDISRATGRDIVLAPEHDGRFVSNIVADLARRWKRPFSLELEGPAGGTYTNGPGGPSIRVDAVEFCRILSGRSEGAGLPTDVVPF